MSQREGAPHADRVEEDGRVLIYEGHDLGKEGLDPKSVDQETHTHNWEPNWRSSSGLARGEFHFLAFSLRIRIAAPREYGRLYGVSESQLRDIEST